MAFDVTGLPNRDLLSDTYRARLLPVFQPIVINELPAVIQRDAPESAACTVTTGLAEDQALDTNWYERRVVDGRPARDPCAMATQVATMVVSNLPPLR